MQVKEGVFLALLLATLLLVASYTTTLAKNYTTTLTKTYTTTLAKSSSQRQQIVSLFSYEAGDTESSPEGSKV